MQDKYPRLTQTQVDLWLDNPVTKTFSDCLGFLRDDFKDSLAAGSFIDSSNADLTLSNVHLNLGHIQALGNAQQFITLFNKFGVIEKENNNA